jgi:hypothetical protein
MEEEIEIEEGFEEETNDSSNNVMTTEEELFSLVMSDLTDRETWESRQETYYRMRNHGLRRKNKPYPGASDMHFPLIDNTIRKLIPFYFAQYSANDVVAKFIAPPNATPDITERIAEIELWFDYNLKEETNLEDELMPLIDYMLESGHGIMKTRWDVEKENIVFDAINPMYIIVPPYTKLLEEADRITEVIQYSKNEYKMHKEYNQSPDLIEIITSQENPYGSEKEDAQYEREGITESKEGQIIIWNTYVKNPSGKWTVHFYSPNAPDRPVRPAMELPYNHGMPPFVDFMHEKKDKRYYSSRGIAELLAVYELSATKMWNLKLDAMAYYNNPIYTVDGVPSGNMSNLSLQPGQIIPNNLRRVDHGLPAISWDTEIQRTQIVAEECAMVPDFGIGDKYSRAAGGGGEKRTATEVSAISQMTKMGVDLKARLFRRALSMVYKQAWSLYQQYVLQTEEQDAVVEVVVGGKLVQITKQQMEQEYRIYPSGSPDSWDRDREYSKSLNRYQLLMNNPYTNQGNLTKGLMEADSPGLSKVLYVDPNEVAASEAEDEAIEIGALLMNGYPAMVKPTDNHQVRIMILATKIMSMSQNQEVAPNPTALQMMMQHMEQHFQGLQQIDNRLAGEVRMQVEQMFASMVGDPNQQQQQATQEQSFQGQPTQEGVIV